jgi:hypothetical protein
VPSDLRSAYSKPTALPIQQDWDRWCVGVLLSVCRKEDWPPGEEFGKEGDRKGAGTGED